MRRDRAIVFAILLALNGAILLGVLAGVIDPEPAVSYPSSDAVFGGEPTYHCQRGWIAETTSVVPDCASPETFNSSDML